MLQRGISAGFCSTSSRRKPGWRFTAGSTFWCNRNTRPESTEFFCDVSLFGDVFGDENHHHMQIHNIQNELCLLKPYFLDCSAWYHSEISIFIWLHFVVRGLFLIFFKRRFSKYNHLIFENLIFFESPSSNKSNFKYFLTVAIYENFVSFVCLFDLRT